jgi:hypothetical protein
LDETHFYEDYKNSLKSNNPVLIGIQYEALFHCVIGKPGFSQIDIYPYSSIGSYLELMSLSFTVSECVRTDDINVSKFKENVYYRPLKFNFTTFNSVFVGDVTFKKKLCLFFSSNHRWTS